MVTTTTMMNNALDQPAASLHTRAGWIARAMGFIAAIFLITMSATEHVGRAATSGESATQAISVSQNHAGSAAVTPPVRTTAAPDKSATQATREAYQQREASSKDVGDFAGGHAGLYIGGSTVAVVLLVVLLVILL